MTDIFLRFYVAVTARLKELTGIRLIPIYNPYRISFMFSLESTPFGGRIFGGALFCKVAHGGIVTSRKASSGCAKVVEIHAGQRV